MKIGVTVTDITEIIENFLNRMTRDMKRAVRKRFMEYLLRMPMPSETGRKSLANIVELVSASCQDTLNKTFHSIGPDLLEENYIP